MAELNMPNRLSIAPPPIPGLRAPRPTAPGGPPGPGTGVAPKLQQAGRLILEAIQANPALGPKLTEVLRLLTEAATDTMAPGNAPTPRPPILGDGGMPPGPEPGGPGAPPMPPPGI